MVALLAPVAVARPVAAKASSSRGAKASSPSFLGSAKGLGVALPPSARRAAMPTSLVASAAARWSSPSPAPWGRPGAPAGRQSPSPPSAEAAAAPAPTNTFAIGIAWFWAHQIIGVINDVIMKFMGMNLGVAQVVFLRFAFATITMLPVMLTQKDSLKTDRVPLHIVRSVLLAAGIAGYVQGLSIAPIAVVTTLNFTIPLFTLALSRVFLNEKVDMVRWIATLVGFAGVMIVLQPGQMNFNPSWLVVLASASMFAGLDVLNKKFVGKESFWAMIFYTALFTALISAVPAMQAWVPPTMSQYGLLALLGGGANLLLFCLLKSFSFVDASALAPFRYTELLLSAAVGFFFFAEVPAASTLLGAAVIVPTTLFVVWAESRAKKDE